MNTHAHIVCIWSLYDIRHIFYFLCFHFLTKLLPNVIHTLPNSHFKTKERKWVTKGRCKFLRLVVRWLTLIFYQTEMCRHQIWSIIVFSLCTWRVCMCMLWISMPEDNNSFIFHRNHKIKSTNTYVQDIEFCI